MQELTKVEHRDGKNLVNGRELHEFLGVGTKFIDWIERRL